MIHRKPTGSMLYLSRKPRKKDFIYFFSAHRGRTYHGMLIIFFLLALRICSLEFLEEEIFSFIFQCLRYSFSMLVQLRGKAKRIMNRTKNNDAQDSPRD